MAFFKEELNNVKAFVFDVDGVLSTSTQSLDREGNLVRTGNIKDGYAIVNAMKQGYYVALITGADTPEVQNRYKNLGVPHLYMGTVEKVDCMNDFLAKTGLEASQVMYMGDDIPDMAVMQMVGVPVCPKDAVMEVKEISKYISHRNGGEGCARDVIEQTLRTQGRWFNTKSMGWSSF